MRAEIAKVRDDVFLEVAQVTGHLKTLETCVSATPLAHEPFSPDVTVIIANLPMLSQAETEAQLLEKVQDVMTNGLSLPGIEAVAVTQHAARGATPGLVLSFIYKLYSSVIKNRLSSYCECNKLIEDEQNGFSPSRSCLDHVFVYHLL